MTARTLALCTLAVVALATITSPVYAACSNATLKGNYGFLVSGTASGNPLAFSGQITADGNGALTGVNTVSNNGSVTAFQHFTGSYNLAASCTGTAAFTPQGGVARNFVLVSISAGKVQMVETDDGVAASGFAQAQGVDHCSRANVHGFYGMQQTGSVIGVGPLAFGGPVNLRADGTLAGTLTGTLNGTVLTNQRVSGAYKIAPTCQGAAVISLNGGQVAHFNIVVDNNANQVVVIDGDSGTVISGVLER